MVKKFNPYTKKVIKFMKKCEADGLSIYEAFEKTVVEFQNPIKILSFRYQAKKHGIVFHSLSSPKIDNIDPKIIKLIEENKDDNIYELRDKVIVKFEKDIKMLKLKTIINNCNIRENAIKN